MLNTLKPSTINIAPYFDGEREYPEVAVLQVVLEGRVGVGRSKRIAHFIHRSISYPLLLLFSCEVEAKDHLLVSLAGKRISQADKEKWVLEEALDTGWIALDQLSEVERQFLLGLAIPNLSFNSFFTFYQSLMACVIAFNCALHSGRFSLSSPSAEGGAVGRLVLLREMEALLSQRTGIKKRLKKERQMGRQVELNTQVKKINDEIAKIKGVL